jgi:hypothetical protein
VEAELSNERRSHSATSASLGTVWKFQPGYSASASFTSGSRMPTAEELFANGLHMATATYEIGNPNLSRERSQALDLGWPRRPVIRPGSSMPITTASRAISTAPRWMPMKGCSCCNTPRAMRALRAGRLS